MLWRTALGSLVFILVPKKAVDQANAPTVDLWLEDQRKRLGFGTLEIKQFSFSLGVFSIAVQTALIQEHVSGRIQPLEAGDMSL